MKVNYAYPPIDQKKRLSWSSLQEVLSTIKETGNSRDLKRYDKELRSIYVSIFNAYPHVCGCLSQWSDWYTKIMLYLKHHDEEAYTSMLSRKYHVTDGHTLVIKGQSYDETNLTDEIAAEFLATEGVRDDIKAQIYAKDEEPVAPTTTKRNVTENKKRKKSVK